MAGTSWEALAPHLDYARRAVRRKVPADDVEDVLQEVCLRALAQLPRADVRDPKRWLSGIVHNTVADHYEKPAPMGIDTPSGGILAEAVSKLVASSTRLPGRAREHRDVRRAVHSLIDALDPSERSLIKLHYGDGFSYAAIAAMLRQYPPLRARLDLSEDTSPEAIRKRVARLKERIIDSYRRMSLSRGG